MAPKYAKDQPEGFVNRIEKVAIVGAGGRLGKWFSEALVKTGKHTVTALTRANSDNPLPQGVIPAIVNYEDESSIVEALKGQQFFIITMHARADPGVHKMLVDAAAKAGVPYVMPNAYGSDPSNSKLMDDIMFGKMFPSFREQCESLGVSTWIALSCGFWYEFSLGGTADRYGFDFRTRAVTFFDDGTTRINTSTFAQCGRAVAALLSLKRLPEDERDEDPTLARWANGVVYVSSFLVSQRDMYESAKRVTGTADADWTVRHESSAERYRRGVEDMKKGDLGGFVRLMYTRMFFPDGGGAYEETRGLQNDVLGLPQEDLDEATKEAVRRGLEGVL